MRQRKWLFMAVAALLMITAGCGAYGNRNADEVAKYTPSGYVITPGVRMEVQASNISFSYEVLETAPELDKIHSKAKQLVREWWDDDSTFVEVSEVVPVICYGDKTPQAFEKDSYVFLNMTYSAQLTTLVHEYVHLQNPHGLQYEDFSGNGLAEMVVEVIAQELAPDASKTSNYRFFVACPKLVEKLDQLEAGFKQKMNASQLYVGIFGPQAKEIVGKLDYYDSLPAHFENSSELCNFLVQILGFPEEDPFYDLIMLYDEIL